MGLLRIIFFIILLLAPVSAFADTHTADSCSAAHVQTAIDAADDGDIVDIPAGSCEWATTVTITDKNIHLRGAGIGTTNITVSTPDAFGGAGILVDNDAGDPRDAFRISGISFIWGTKTASSGGSNIITVYSAGPTFRIDGNSFTSAYAGGNFISIGRDLGQIPATFAGLIDNNTFTTTTGTSPCSASQPKAFEITATDYATETASGEDYGAASWAADYTYGGEYGIFIENNTFTWSCRYPFIDSDNGARVVIRYNTITGAGIGTHGSKENGADWGVRVQEIYNNAFDANGTQMWDAIAIRGGTGVIYGNTITGNYSDQIQLYLYCCCDPKSASCTADQCTSYPCDGQIGRGKDNALDPMYIWNNGGATISTDSCDEVPTFVQENRDYYLSARPTYTAYTCPHPTATTQDSLTGACLTNTAGTGGYNQNTTHTVTSSKVGAVGTLSYEGDEVVADAGNSQTYTATDPNGWRHVWSGTCGATGSAATYQKTGVSEDCTVVCTFKEIPIGGVR